MIFTGQVFSTEMDILEGANVVETTSGRSTTTNDEGRFTLNVDSMDSPLKISFVGYDYDTFTPNEINATNGVAYLFPASGNTLDEVTVYGQGKKSDNTILWILAAIAGTIAAVKIAANKPKKVKP